MKGQLLESAGFKYLEKGEGKPIVILHGLMGGLSNFQGVTDHFPELGYKVIIPMLPIYDLPLLKTNVKQFALYVNRFVEHLNLDDVLVVGNSLGGHIGLLFTKLFPEKVKGLIITGSSGLYENSMGESYPKRENY
jgi:pimeloyl-ACP methyl ester carboxylesterase